MAYIFTEHQTFFAYITNSCHKQHLLYKQATDKNNNIVSLRNKFCNKRFIHKNVIELHTGKCDTSEKAPY